MWEREKPQETFIPNLKNKELAENHEINQSIKHFILLSSFMYSLMVILIFQVSVLAPSIFLYI